MSGRAYARDAQGFLGGGADLESIVPHTFRIASPKRSLSARELGIRRVIRRRSMEKNWRKIISRRHVREVQETEAAEEDQVEETDSAMCSNSAAPSTQPAAASSSANDSTAVAASAAASGSSAAKPSAENGARKPKTETAPDSETVALARRQLEELEAKLQTLVEEKHAKFVQLKSILVEEARSKSSTPTPADTTAVAATGVAKKRRVEFKDSVAVAASSADLSATAASGSSPVPVGGVTSGPSATSASSAAPATE